ncbi:unnamed protein product [Rhizopus stolonifer]
MLEFIPGQVFVGGVLCLISFISYSPQVFLYSHISEWKEFIYLLAPFNLLVFFVFYNYYLAVSTDPGKIPFNWEPPSSLVPANHEGITGPRYCKACQLYKPPRSHHCRYCKRCVLKMDHHCPWINNCVGHENYGHFFQFIVFVDLACIYHLALLVGRVRAIMEAIRHFQFDAEPSTFQIIMIVSNFVLSFVVLFAVGTLSGYQFYCLLRNQTNIEAWERGKVETLVRRGKIRPVDYPYDISLYKNLCQVLGANPVFWLFPQKAPGDGLVFPVISQTDPRLPYYWPPRDPDDLRPSIFSAKYKRQQEAKRLMVEDVGNESDGYYDSGSCLDSDEYDEEESMKSFINGRLYDISGTYVQSEEEDDDIPLSQYKKKE